MKEIIISAPFSNILPNSKRYTRIISRRNLKKLPNKKIIASIKWKNYVSFIEDLKLLSSQKRSTNKLNSLKYIQEYNFYKQKLSELNTRFQKINEDFNRSQKLFEKGVIAKVALNNSKLEYDLSLNAINQYKKQQHSSWQAALVNHQNQLNHLLS